MPVTPEVEVVATTDRLVVRRAGEPDWQRRWLEIDSARWDDEERALQVVDVAGGGTTLDLVEDDHLALAQVVRERVQSTLVTWTSVDVPGGEVRVVVRKDGDALVLQEVADLRRRRLGRERPGGRGRRPPPARVVRRPGRAAGGRDGRSSGHAASREARRCVSRHARQPGADHPWCFATLSRPARAPSRVAQLAEHPTVNRTVTGSSPVAGASDLRVCPLGIPEG